MKRIIAAFAILLLAQGAQAATFCVGGPGISRQCLYEDVRLCQRAAKPPESYCTINPQAVLSYLGGSRYCVVDSSRLAQCLYTDRNQCNDVAARSASVCIERQTDEFSPFSNDTRVQN